MKRALLITSGLAACFAALAMRGSSRAQSGSSPTGVSTNPNPQTAAGVSPQSEAPSNVQGGLGTNAQTTRQLFGIYPGVVVSAQDTSQRGRLLLRIPVLSTTSNYWARPSVPYVDGTMASIKLPPPDTGVWVQFMNGDPTFPVWVGWMPR